MIEKFECCLNVEGKFEHNNYPDPNFLSCFGSCVFDVTGQEFNITSPV